MRYSILCIFLTTGATFTFKDVEVILDNESCLLFNYAAMSDSKLKTANFPKGNIAGWSVTAARIKDLATKEQKQ